ncbi:MAG: esterase family protein [Trueperaceae bacterium]|nr:esterase family protein [Trueperaceae bacterium]
MQVTIKVPDWASYVLSDLTDMDRNPQPLNPKTIRSFKLSLPDDCYFEYAFVREDRAESAADIDAKVLEPDPENDLRADNPWYPGISALQGPAYKPDPLADPILEAKGKVRRFRLESEHLAQTRRIISYTPEGFDDKPLASIYIQDGVAYYRIARLPEVLETLIAEGYPPAHLIFVEPGDRAKEYRYNPHYQGFMVEELLPFIADELGASQERVVMGASLGGLMSGLLALNHPHLFQTVISQSGAFIGSPDELDFYSGKSSWVLETLQQEKPLPLRWYVDTGKLEWLYPINKQIAETLQAKGYDTSYAERNSGHNWVTWRNGLGDALRFALSGLAH